MAEKRRVSARIKQEAPAQKRARLERIETSKKADSKSVKTVETPPAKSKDNKKSLPTVEHSQYSETSANELKSIAESGVLAASLRQSRSKWLSDGILQRYWVKPAKKKDQAEIRNNPPKETMQKIGPCTLKVEPHTFDATLFLVRDVRSSQPITKPAQRPFLQYGPPGSGSFGYAGPNSPAGYPRYMGTPSASPQTVMPMSQQFQNRPQPQGSQNGPTALSQPPNFPKPSQDPVIQMLATRASTNPELKALMKVVASGHATHEELKIFQSHIDDLNAILQSQMRSHTSFQTKSPGLPYPPTSQQSQTSSAASPSTPSISNPPSANQIPFPPPKQQPPQSPQPPASQTAPSAVPASPVTPATSIPPATSVPQATSAPPKPLPAPNPHANSVVLELAGGSGDRYLLPRHSILESVPGRQEFIVSFLVVRKGNAADESASSSMYSAKHEYYQPVTIRLSTDYPRVFEAIYRAVAPPDEVRKHMDQVIATTTRAELVHLQMQLPPDAEELHDLAGPKGAAFDGRPVKPKRDRQDAAEPRCRYCFALLPLAESQRQDGEAAACRACSTLVHGKPSVAYNVPGLVFHEPIEQPSAVQSLTLSSLVV